MPTRDEKDILKILEEEGGEKGELHEVKLSRFMGLRLDYIRSILDSMGRRNLIDVFNNGKVNIGDKGWRTLGKTPPSEWGELGDVPKSELEDPIDKYKRWLSGEAPKKAKKEKSSDNVDESKPSSIKSYADLSPEERFKKWAVR